MSTDQSQFVEAFQQPEQIGKCTCESCKENCVCNQECQSGDCKSCSCGVANQTPEHPNEIVLEHSTKVCNADATISTVEHGKFIHDHIKE